MTLSQLKQEGIDRKRVILVTALVGAVFVATAFLLEAPREVMRGEWQILTAPSILITDYIAVGGIGAAFFNAGVVTLLCLAFAMLLKASFNGFFLAAVFTVAGFAFFGKTPFNVLPIFLGVYLYDRFLAPKRSANLIAVMLFATTLGPVVSQTAFGFGWGWAGIPAGITLGTLAGLLVGALSGHIATFHMGYNLYNIGTTAGFVGTVLYIFMRAFGLEITSLFHWSTEYTAFLAGYTAIVMLIFVLTGFLWGAKLSSYKRILTHSGRMPSDFTASDGLANTMLNMGLVGLVCLAYVLLIGGDINGAILAGIYTALGFGALGKHPLNIIPVMVGVFLMSIPSKWAATEPGPMLAALFGITLAPFSGKFGPLAGVIAGVVHLPMLMHVGGLHGFMNLYNNGFAGGLVMLLLVGIIKGVKPDLLLEPVSASGNDPKEKNTKKKSGRKKEK